MPSSCLIKRKFPCLSICAFAKGPLHSSSANHFYSVQCFCTPPLFHTFVFTFVHTTCLMFLPRWKSAVIWIDIDLCRNIFFFHCAFIYSRTFHLILTKIHTHGLWVRDMKYKSAFKLMLANSSNNVTINIQIHLCGIFFDKIAH